MFLTMMVIGIVGLVMMALPALGGHHLPPGGHGVGHALGHAAGTDHGVGVGNHAPHAGELASGHATATSVAVTHGVGTGAAHLHPTYPNTLPTLAIARPNRRFIPSPRAVFSVLALYGAFGNALVHAAHLRGASAALIAIGPALLVEWFLIRPVWNLMFRFQGEASSPLGELIFAEAQAVVPFRNGRGLVSTVRDGRRVQLHAQLCDEQAAASVRFGQRLRIEDVDARRERVTVSLLPDPAATRNPTST